MRLLRSHHTRWIAYKKLVRGEGNRDDSSNDQRSRECCVAMGSASQRGRTMHHALFGFINFEIMVVAWAITAARKLRMQIDHVLFQVGVKRRARLARSGPTLFNPAGLPRGSFGFLLRARQALLIRRIVVRSRRIRRTSRRDLRIGGRASSAKGSDTF
jgi:hypothetical protein